MSCGQADRAFHIRTACTRYCRPRRANCKANLERNAQQHNNLPLGYFHAGVSSVSGMDATFLRFQAKILIDVVFRANEGNASPD